MVKWPIFCWVNWLLLTLVAIPLGMLIGYGLCAYLAFQFDTDLYRIPLVLGMNVYAFAASGGDCFIHYFSYDDLA